MLLHASMEIFGAFGDVCIINIIYLHLLRLFTFQSRKQGCFLI